MSFNLWPRSGEGAAGVDCANIMSDVNVLDGAIFESMECEDAEEDLVAWDDMKQRELNPTVVKDAR